MANGVVGLTTISTIGAFDISDQKFPAMGACTQRIRCEGTGLERVRENVSSFEVLCVSMMFGCLPDR